MTGLSEHILLNVRVLNSHTHTHTCSSTILSLILKTTMSFPANGKIYSHCLHINSKYANIHYVAENLFIRDFATTHSFHSGEQCRHRIKCELLHSVGAQLPGKMIAEKEKKNMSTIRESERNNANLHLINFSVALLFKHTNTTALRWFFFSLCDGFSTIRHGMKFGFVISFNQKPCVFAM